MLVDSGSVCFVMSSYHKLPQVVERGTKDTKGTVKLINLKQTDNAMAKNEKRTNKQQHTRHNIEN